MEIIIYFPLSKYLLKPYRNLGNLNPRQILFNKRISKTRIIIENTFGLLKSRFRRLHFIDAKIENITNIIISCCVLHNICLKFNDIIPEEQIEVEHNANFMLGDNFPDNDVNYRDFISENLI